MNIVGSASHIETPVHGIGHIPPGLEAKRVWKVTSGSLLARYSIPPETDDQRI
jgi:hypothetical protein